jgi:hypothetical protein
MPLEPPAHAAAAAAATPTPRTIHDTVNVKEPGLAAFLHYDRHERRSGLVPPAPRRRPSPSRSRRSSQCHDLRGNGRLRRRRLRAGHARSSAVHRGRRRAGTAGVEKTYRFGGGRGPSLALELATTVENPGDTVLAFELAVEWNVNLLGGGHNPAAYYETDGRADPARRCRRSAVEPRRSPSATTTRACASKPGRSRPRD